MQIAEAPTTASNVLASPSFALDLSWFLHAACKDYLCQRHPVLGALYEEHPDVAAKVRGFWDDELTCFTDVEAMAHRAGVLTATDPAAVLAGIEGAAGDLPDWMAMPSEGDVDEAGFNRRLIALRDDPRRRRRYLALVEEVASLVAGPWATEGLPAAQATASIVSGRLEQGALWMDLIPLGCETLRAHKEEIIAEVAAGATALVAICVYFGTALYLNFEGSIIVGTGIEREDLAARARTEDLARRLRILSDPTRLAIVDYLAGAPHTIGDITKAFHLAQPTVSNHVKALREAGLVVAEREDGKLMVRANRQAVTDLVDRLAGVLP
jgi:ArsR family transcriptional regulator, arsenate/arsenite/antimonite-responsive transcriptional repressor